MLRADDYPVDQLPILGPEVVRRLGALVALRPGRGVRVGEPLGVWTLTPEALEKLATFGAAPSSLARDTHRWHHLISVDGRVVGHAISRVDDGEPRVVEVGAGPVGAKIGRALRAAAAHRGAPEAIARILEVPRIGLEALWLSRTDAAHEFVLGDGPNDRLLGEEEFRMIVASSPLRSGLVPPELRRRTVDQPLWASGGPRGFSAPRERVALRAPRSMSP